MTVPSAASSGQPEDAAVIVIDLRAGATGPDAFEPGSLDERTLEECQRRNHHSGSLSEWRIINFERLLVVDDATTFAEHEDAYRHLIEAPTFGRMLCAVIGAPAEPPYLDLPQAAEAARAPVLWLGDARGVGWHIGRANTTRLAFSDSDPDGSATVANLIESLTSPRVFDEIARTIIDLPDRTGVPALLPWAQWPICHRHADDQDRKPENDEPQEGGQAKAITGTLSDPHAGPDAAKRQPWRMPLLLVVLACAIIALATLLTIRFSQLNSEYGLAATASATAILLVLLVIAYRRWTILMPPPPAGAAEPSASQEPQLPLRTPPRDDGFHAIPHWMINVEIADEAFRQLSSPEQLVMLNGDPELARLVRFAPASARPLIADAMEDDSITWTMTGNQLGIIRLVPMKAGLVRHRAHSQTQE